MSEELLPGVFLLDHQVADGKNVVLVGPRGALVVDVSMTVEEGEVIAAFVRSLGAEPNRVLLTHGHTDHVLGGPAFRGAEVYARVETPAVIRDHLRGFAARRGLDYEAVLAQALWPTMRFSDEFWIDMGDRELHVFPTPGHSPDSVSVYSASDRLLLASDTVATAIVPVCQDGDGRALEASLRRLRAMEIDVLVCGHGPALRGRDAITDHLDWSIGYLAGIRATARAALASGECDPAALADGIRFDDFVGGRLPRDRFNMPVRHRNTVMKIVEEELAAADAVARERTGAADGTGRGQ